MKKIYRNKQGERLYTLAEFLEQTEAQLKESKYYSVLYKQLKAILKEQNHWKDKPKGGSFQPGNPYRFTKS